MTGGAAVLDAVLDALAGLAGAAALGGVGALGGAALAAGAFAATALETGSLAGGFAVLGKAVGGATAAGFTIVAPVLGLSGAGVEGAGALGELFCLPAGLGWSGLDWDLGMEVARGGTCFADAAAAFTALGGVASLATFAALGVTGLAEELGEDAVLEAEGIDREPLVRGLEMLTLLSEPIFWGAVFWICVEAGCGFLVGIP